MTKLERQAQQIPPIHALPSALKKNPAFSTAHRRVFSHGQITFSNHSEAMGERAAIGSELVSTQSNSNKTSAQFYSNDFATSNELSRNIPPTLIKKGHRRAGSKTDFILPPGHEERERKRALQR